MHFCSFFFNTLSCIFLALLFFLGGGFPSNSVKVPVFLLKVIIASEFHPALSSSMTLITEALIKL